ncbi:hypothetical protein HK096_000047 [Nowakowskiella sp. JEL0078]|nr:hypothetical protein HK096_000047 [Nowakowskiella sp. JEL0078]
MSRLLPSCCLGAVQRLSEAQVALPLSPGFRSLSDFFFCRFSRKIRALAAFPAPDSGFVASPLDAFVKQNQRLLELNSKIASLDSKILLFRQNIASLKDTIKTLKTKSNVASSLISSRRNDVQTYISSSKPTVATLPQKVYTHLSNARQHLFSEVLSVFRIEKVLPFDPTLPSTLSLPKSIPLKQSVSLGDFASNTNTALSQLPSQRRNSLSLGSPPPHLSTSASSHTTYSILSIPYSVYGGYNHCPLEQFNTSISHILHMTILLSHYLDVTLPYKLTLNGDKSSVTTISDMRWTGVSVATTANITEFPLVLNDINIEEFTVGLALLNYDIVFVCWCCGIEVEFTRVPEALENLKNCCEEGNRRGLGMPPFALDLAAVVRLQRDVRSWDGPGLWNGVFEEDEERERDVASEKDEDEEWLVI